MTYGVNDQSCTGMGNTCNDSIMVRYQFEFRQGETVIYTGDQTAMWARVQEGQEPLPGEL